MNCVKFNSLLKALSAILLCEIGGVVVLQNILTLSKIETIFILRTVETVLMILITIQAKYKEFKDKNPKVKKPEVKLNWFNLYSFTNHSFDHIKKGVKAGFTWSFYLGIIAVAGGILILLVTQNNPILLFKSPFIEDLRQNGRLELTIFLITACIVSPFAEELFFRGFLYSFFRKYGVFFALVASTLIFTLCHITSSISKIPLVPLTGGVIFALSYQYSKSLAAPIIIHILGNTAIFTLSFLN
ncbi:MAG: CPBP family intramembrane metalloprotease [Desulfamplus sp.]|nr:CPBP family intramembrane metalloprotease [Desulfamplus sp.]